MGADALKDTAHAGDDAAGRCRSKSLRNEGSDVTLSLRAVTPGNGDSGRNVQARTDLGILSNPDAVREMSTGTNDRVGTEDHTASEHNVGPDLGADTDIDASADDDSGTDLRVLADMDQRIEHGAGRLKIVRRRTDDDAGTDLATRRNGTSGTNQ